MALGITKTAPVCIITPFVYQVNVGTGSPAASQVNVKPWPSSTKTLGGTILMDDGAAVKEHLCKKKKIKPEI